MFDVPSSALLPARLWLRSRARLFGYWMRRDDPARARRELRRALRSGTLPVENLFSCPGCGTNRSPWLLATVERMAIPHRTVLCPDCGLSYASSRMTPAAQDAFYQGLYWRLPDTAAALEDTSERFSRGESILSWTGERVPAGGLVVELGCGPGYNLVPFQRAGFRTLGYERDVQCAALARERFHLDVRAGGLGELIASGIGADLLVVAHVLEHLSDPKQFLVSTRTALAPGGMLYVEVPGLRNLDHPSYGGNLLSYLQIAHLFNFTRLTLTQLIETSGFEALGADESVRVLARVAGSPSPDPYCKRDSEGALHTLRYLGAKEGEHIARFPLRLWRGARSLLRRTKLPV